MLLASNEALVGFRQHNMGAWAGPGQDERGSSILSRQATHHLVEFSKNCLKWIEKVVRLFT